MKNPWVGVLCPLLLAAAALWAYHNSFNGPFVHDDLVSIPNNPHLRQLLPLSRSMTAPPDVDPLTQRPIVCFSLALNYAWGELNVQGYHAFNLCVHILVALILFGVIRRTLETPRLRGRFGQSSVWLALSIALIWAVHPLLTQSVTFIIRRSELLLGLFYLLTLYGLIRNAEGEGQPGWAAAAILFCALGMATKQVMVTAPLSALLYDRIFLSSSFGETLKHRWKLHAGLAATWLLLGAVILASPPIKTVGDIPFWDYAATQPGVILHYLRLSVWPHPLIFDYDWPLAKTTAEILPPMLALGTLLGITAWALRRWPGLGFLGIFFFLFLFPSSMTPMQKEIAAEQRMYLPLAALVALAVLGINAALRRLFLKQPHTRRLLEIGSAIGIVAVMGAATLRRNDDYKSEISIWRDVVAKQPMHVKARSTLGAAFTEQGMLAEAVAQCKEAIRIQPDYPEAHYNLGIALALQGQLQQAAASYTKALELDPGYFEAHNNLGLVLFRQGKTQEAIGHYQQALRLAPNSAEVQNNLGTAFFEQGKLEEATACFSAAARLKPDFADAHFNLGLAFTRQGKLSEAASAFLRATQLRPDDTEAHYNLGLVLRKLGQAEEATRQFQAAGRRN